MSITISSLLSKSARVALAATLATGLVACGSITKVGDIPEYLDSPFADQGPKEFITPEELRTVRLGMSYLEVKNRLGPPILNDQEAKDRWDYVLRRGTGADEEYVPMGIFFSDDKAVRVAALQQPPESIAGQELPVAQPEVVEAAPEPAPEPVVNDAELIANMLNAWVASWAGQDVDSYLAFYDSSFAHGMSSRSAWEQLRIKRLTKPEYISVSLSNVEIDLQSETMAEVRFQQEYEANTYQDKGAKVLTLVKSGDQWLIQKESFSK